MSRYLSASECIEIALLGNLDFLKRDKGRLMKWSKYVYQDMNLTSLKIARRERFAINKKTNSIDLPCNFLQLSSVDVEDECGNLYPVYRNDNIKDSDIVDVGASKDCACEFGCAHKLCNTIKSYEAIVSTKTDKYPNGDDVSFECIDRKGIMGDKFYEETQYPLRQYVSGVWINTIRHTEQRVLCEVEIDENGCVCDTEENINRVCGSCGIDNNNQSQCCIGGTANCPPKENCDTWIYYCDNKMEWFGLQCGQYPYFKKGCNNVYNISELGDRLIFPHNFGWDKVIIRWYPDSGLNEIKIPMIAVNTFIMGLKWWDCQFNDKKQKEAAIYGQKYAVMKFGLLRELNKYRLAELRMILSPPMFVPSNVLDRAYNRLNGVTPYGYGYGY